MTLPSKPRIISASPEKWCELATDAIVSTVKSYINAEGECSLMLTGGNTAKQLYQHWAVSQPWDHRKIRYYFGDERCVPPEHPDSNSGMVRQALFPEGILKDCMVTRMEGELSNREMAAKKYEKILPKAIDVLLLSVGLDGHIASLFPGSTALQEKARSVVPVVSPKPPPERLTITPRVIQSAKSTFLFSQGKEKRLVLSKALQQPDDIATLPVRLVFDATWILDTDAAN